jgi:uncharacterized protein (DUF302 family)
MMRWIVFIAVLLLSTARAGAADGLITIRSSYPVKVTIDRLETEVKSRGLTIFARVDHAAGASQAGLTLRPTDLLIFGNPKTGTPLMQANQAIGIDLPLKALAWEDAAGAVWLSYNDPDWIARRHALDGASASTIAAVSAMLDAVSRKAAGAP